MTDWEVKMDISVMRNALDSCLSEYRRDCSSCPLFGHDGDCLSLLKKEISERISLKEQDINEGTTRLKKTNNT